MSEGSIDLKNVTLAFGRGAVTALENFTLAVRPGELLSVLGPSGCGKSSLINAITGFLPPRSGALHVDGEPRGEPGSDRGVVFQQPTLFPWRTVRQNVEFGLKPAQIDDEGWKDAGRGPGSAAGDFANWLAFSDETSSVIGDVSRIRNHALASIPIYGYAYDV